MAGDPDEKGRDEGFEYLETMLGFFNQIRVEFGVPIPLDCLDGVLIVNKKPDRFGFRPRRGNIEVLEGCR